MRIELRVNGEQREADAHGAESLLFVLRERLDLPGAKGACEEGECGSCSVLLDGQLVCACLVHGAQADGRLHAVQRAFLAAGAVQCGFCKPGLVVATVALLANDPSPSEDDVREALSGNLCRCTGYGRIFEAVRQAAAELRA